MSIGLAPLSAAIIALSGPSPSENIEKANFVFENDYERVCQEHLQADGSSKILSIRSNRMTPEEYCHCVFEETKAGVQETMSDQRASSYVAPREAVQADELERAYSLCLTPPAPYQPPAERR